MRLLKIFLIRLLTPFVALHEKFWEPWRRIWRHAKAGTRIHIHPSCVLTGPIHIEGTGAITIGGKAHFYRDIHLETRQQGEIRLGEGVVISSGTHVVSFFGVHIGDKVMIGEFCSIRDANHRMGTGTDYRESGYQGRPIRIGRNAWLGRGVCVLPGVEIGANSIIGANSVVTKSIPDNCLAVGAPARVVKQGLDS